jgi:hypothetical protein
MPIKLQTLEVSIENIAIVVAKMDNIASLYPAIHNAYSQKNMRMMIHLRI